MLDEILSYFRPAREKKERAQFMWRGDEDVLALASFIYPKLTEYVDWYCEKGLYLPPEFRTDPSSWTNILRDMQEAFRLLHSGEYKIEEEAQSKVDQGLEFFGKYFRHLWK